MTREEAKSCIQTIELLRRLAFNVHGVMDVIDAGNCDKIIAMLSQEPCGDCISRVDAMRAITDEWVRTHGNHSLEGFTDAIYNLPPVIPEQPVMTGEWVTTRTKTERQKARERMKYKYIVGYCSDCGKVTKWRKECPKGVWHCMNCNGKAESEDKG